ncbi:MAG: tetratricopeptide repeat protein [Puniceicoccaceae bacterium]
MSGKVKSPRLVQPSVPRFEFSRELREVNHSLGKQEVERALQHLDRLASQERSSLARAKVIHLIATSQFQLARYDEALSLYRRAARITGQEAGKDPELILSSALGAIRCLLKAQRLTEALEEALRLEQVVQQRLARYRKIVATSLEAISETGELEVEARPVRKSVALTRIGSTFFEEGYLETAEEFLLRVVQMVPMGGSRARQILAEIALLKGDFVAAETYATESLVFGKFRAKTIPAWRQLIQARRRQGKDGVERRFFLQYRKAQTGGRVSARTEMLILSELRRYSDPLWQTLALEWYRQGEGRDSITRIEILKILLAEGPSVFNGEPARLLPLIREIFDEPMLAPSESIGLAKALGEYGIAGGREVADLLRSLLAIRRRFDNAHYYRSIHSFALGLIKGRNFSEARSVFQDLISTQTPGSELWAKALWALARMEREQGNLDSAAAHYLDFASAGGIPIGFRLQAFLRWVRLAPEAGTEIDLEGIRLRVRGMVAEINDHNALLDAARQLGLAGRDFEPITREVVLRAEAKAIEAFEQAVTPEEALPVLVRLTRRQYFDFTRHKQILSLYEGFSEEKVGWLWSKDARFWEYLSLVMLCYLNKLDSSTGIQFAESQLAEPTVPHVGRVYLAMEYGLWLLENGDVEKSLAVLRQAIEASPRHRKCAEAHYWIGLKASLGGHVETALQSLELARGCLSPRPALLSEWMVDAKSGLMLERLSPGRPTAELSRYDADFVAAQRGRLDKNLSKLK